MATKRPREEDPVSADGTSSSSSAAATTAAAAEANETPRKRAKFDDDDIDWLIGDLRKEEAQLVLTRLVRSVGEASVRLQIDIVRHAREQFTADQLKQQVELMRELRKIQETAPLFMPRSPDPNFAGMMGGMMSPMMMMHGGAGGAGGAFGDVQSPSARQPGISAARLKGIKSRIGASFKKDSNAKDRYNIQEDAIEQETQKAKEMLSRNAHDDALKIMEAITEEVVERASPISVKINNLKEIMDGLGKEWIDIFLSSLFELSEDEKEDWSEKLRGWDILSADSESIFSCARFAARNMWNNSKLQAILKGEHNDTANQILLQQQQAAAAAAASSSAGGEASKTPATTSSALLTDQQLQQQLQTFIGFQEPKSLIDIRVTWLEREKKIDDALNLSLALGLFVQAAKFQIKLNRVADAVETTNKIHNGASLFYVAQIAKPVNVDFAFDLVLQSIVRASLEDPLSTAETLAAQSVDIVQWAINLAESESKTDRFVQQIGEKVKSKSFQYGIFNLLLQKEKQAMALDLAEIILRPYSLAELQAIFLDLKLTSPSFSQAWERQERSLSDEQKALFLQHRPSLVNFLRACVPPKSLPNRMYLVVRQLLNALVQQQQQQPGVDAEALLQRQLQLNEKIYRIIEKSLEYVDENVDSLMELLSSLASDSRDDDVFRVGFHLVNLVKRHAQTEEQFQEKRCRDKFEFDELKKQQQQQASAASSSSSLLALSVFAEPVRNHPIYNFAEKNTKIFSIMISTALRTQTRNFAIDPVPVAMSDESSVVAAPASLAVQETEEERKQREVRYHAAIETVRTITSKIFDFFEDPEAIIQIARSVSTQCPRIAVSVLQGNFENINKLKAVAESVREHKEELADLNKEINKLLEDKQKPSAEQLQRLKDFQLRGRLDDLLPNARRQSEKAYDKNHYDSGYLLINTALKSKNNPQNAIASLLRNAAFQADEIFPLVDQVLEYVKSPNNLLELATMCNDCDADAVVGIYVANKATIIVRDLYGRWLAQSLIETELEQLTSEQSELQDKFKKDLEDVQLKRLEELEAILNNESTTTTLNPLPYFALNKDAGFFHGLQYQITTLKIKALSSQRNNIINRIERPSLEITPEIEKLDQEQLQAIEARIVSTMEGCLDELQLCSHFRDFLDFWLSFNNHFGGSLQKYSYFDLELALAITRRAFAAFKVVENEILEQSVRAIDLDLLEKEAQSLWLEFQTRQMLTPEQRQQARKLGLEKAIFEQRFSGCESLSVTQVGAARKQMVLKLLSSVSTASQSLSSQRAQLVRQIEELLVQTRTETTEPQLLRLKTHIDSTEENYARNAAGLLSVVKLTLDEIDGPGTLQSVIEGVAKTLSFDINKADSGLQEVALSQLDTLVHRLFSLLETLEAERLERSETYEAIANIEREQSESVALRKPVTKETLAQLQKLKRQVQIWDSLVSYRRLKADNIVAYYSEASNLLARYIVDRKTTLENSISELKNQISSLATGAAAMSDESSLTESLTDVYQARKTDSEKRLEIVSKSWAELSAFILKSLANPAHLITFMPLISNETDLTIQFAQQTFARATALKAVFEQRKPVHDEYQALLQQRSEFLLAGKSLRPEELQKFSELAHQIFLWNNEASFLHSNLFAINKFFKSTSELLLRTIFRKINTLNDSISQLELLNASAAAASDDSNVAAINANALLSIRGEFKILSVDERNNLLTTLKRQLEETITLFNGQLEACFPYLTEPSHLIDTAQMCKNAQQLDSTITVCQQAIKCIQDLEKQRHEYALLYRELYILELEQFYATEFRIPFDGQARLAELRAKVESLASLDLSHLAGSSSHSSYSSSSKHGSSSSYKQSKGGRKGYGGGYGSFIIQPSSQSLSTTACPLVRNFYQFLNQNAGSGANFSPEVLNLNFDRYSSHSDNPAFPVDQAGKFVHSTFVNNLQQICLIMTQAFIEKRNRYLALIAEQRRCGVAIDEDLFQKTSKQHNALILDTFKLVSETLDDHKAFHEIVRAACDLDSIHSIESTPINALPSNLSRLSHSDFDLAMPLVRLSLEKTRAAHDAVKALEEPLIAFATLLSEEQTLNQQRKELDAAKLAQLRDLRKRFGMLFAERFTRRQALQGFYDLEYQLVIDSVQIVILKKRQKDQELDLMVRQPRLVRGHSMNADEIQQEFTNSEAFFKERLDQAVLLALEFINEPSNLSSLASYLNSNKHMNDVIRVSTKAQDALKTQLVRQLQFESLVKRVGDIQKTQIVSSAIASNPSDELQSIYKQIDELRHRLTDNAYNLRNEILQLANLMIDAARAENRSEVIEQQSILVFKMTMSVEKFEEVRTLVGEDRWTSSVRDELLTWVDQYDPTLPGSPIRLLDVIELLIRESWWQQALRHCPEPSPNDASESIEILKLLWYAVEKDSPADLEKLVPTIEAFTIKEFQKFNLDTMDTVLDVVQTKYPKLIYDLYVKGADIMLTNSGTKKYNLFIDFLTVMKRRLLTVGLIAEWNDFMSALRRKEARKKNLINMFNVAEL